MWQKTSKPYTRSLQKKELRRWLNEMCFSFLIHKLWRSALTPEKDRRQSKFSSLREVTCTWEGACISMHFCTFSLVFIDFHWFPLIFIDFHWFSLLNSSVEIDSKQNRPQPWQTYLLDFERADGHKNWWKVCRRYKVLRKLTDCGIQ